MEQGTRRVPRNYRRASTLPPTLHRVAPEFAERQRSVPRLGDIWIPRSEVSPNHFVRLYIHGVQTCFRWEIVCFGWSTMDPDPA
jgi:hypothetical protein